MDSENQLISICMPTYNRRALLEKRLLNVCSQNYTNIEIILSNNCSTDPEVEILCQDFAKKDTRIRYFKQDTNIGSMRNLEFVFHKAKGKYAIFAADDDRWLSDDFLHKLIRLMPDYDLVFPDIRFAENPADSKMACYSRCKTQWEYTLAFCSTGAGYPFYGLYNLDRMRENNISFFMDYDLAYYNEGTFLHDLFLRGRTLYVPEALMEVIPFGALQRESFVLPAFVEYFFRTFELYNQSYLPFDKRAALLCIFSTVYNNELMRLINDLPDQQRSKIVDECNFVNDAIFPLSPGTTKTDEQHYCSKKHLLRRLTKKLRSL